MACIDNTNTKVLRADFFDNTSSMVKRVNSFIQKNKRNPSKVSIKPGGTDYVTYTKYQDMYKRFLSFFNTNKRYPSYIYVTAPITKSAFHLSVESAVGTYDNFTQYYGRILKKTYGHYSNDVYTQLQEIQRLKGNLPLNCSDHSQLGFATAKDMGYDAKFIHVKCNVSKAGHIYLQVRGKELGPNWVNVDLAAASSPGSRYPIGKTWCTAGAGGTKISENDPWLLSDDGKT